MKKEILSDMEDRNNYFVLGCRDKTEALKLIKKEMFNKGNLTISELSEVVMKKCLDCGSSWVSDDVCGECGEDRLGKREKRAFMFEVLSPIIDN
jgi:hypothetical protein